MTWTKLPETCVIGKKAAGEKSFRHPSGLPDDIERIIMKEDEVIREVHRIKDTIAAEYNYDVHKLVAALKEKQNKRGRKVVSRKPKRAAG